LPSSETICTALALEFRDQNLVRLRIEAQAVAGLHVVGLGKDLVRLDFALLVELQPVQSAVGEIADVEIPLLVKTSARRRLTAALIEALNDRIRCGSLL